MLRRTETFEQWWNCNRGWLFHGALALKCTNFLNLRLVPSWVTNLVLKSFSGPALDANLLCLEVLCQSLLSVLSINTHINLEVQYLLEMSGFSWICFNQNVLNAGNKHSWLKVWICWEGGNRDLAVLIAKPAHALPAHRC